MNIIKIFILILECSVYAFAFLWFIFFRGAAPIHPVPAPIHPVPYVQAAILNMPLPRSTIILLIIHS